MLNEIECYKSLERTAPAYGGIQKFVSTLKSTNNIYLIFDQIHEGTIHKLS